MAQEKQFQKYGTDPEMEKLVNDEDMYVRAAVAEQGYGLDELIVDEAWLVRQAVAEQGYGLKQLINDKCVGIRLVAAQQGFGLHTLINDESEWVRQAVARQGYGLDKLINDESDQLDCAISYYLSNNNYRNIQDWIAQNPDKCALPENRKQATQKEFKPKGLELNQQAKSQPNPGKDER